MMGAKEIMAAASAGDLDDEGATFETDRLRESIAETRESIGSTLQALQDRLHPSALAEQARTAVRDATIGKVEDMIYETEERITRTGQSLYDSARRHPIPLAVAGIGIAWFVASRRRDSRLRAEQRALRGERITTRYRSDEDFRLRSAPTPGVMPEAEERPGVSAVEPGGNGHREEGLSGKVERAAREVAGKAEELTEQGTERMAEAAREARETVRRAAREAGERGRRLEGRMEEMFHDNPLAAGAIAVAAGTAIGLAIPISHKEEEWMGPARDRLFGKAGELAHEALEKVEEAAGRVQDVASRVEGVARDVEQGAAQARSEPGAAEQAGGPAPIPGR